MNARTIAPASIRQPEPAQPRESRGVRLPAGADSKLFGGWGVRF